LNKVSIKNGCFVINGKKQFILSGEIQYFRLERKRWELVISRLKEAGCNTLSTYVPWNWHEYEKNKLDFNGRTHPSRDLNKFLKLVKGSGLNLIIKIGPYIHAEFKNGGIPEWLFNDHKEILCVDPKGDPTRDYHFYPPYTYLHPVFMEQAKKWYSHVLKVLLSYDNIILWQVDNEVSYGMTFWNYFKGQAFNGDYNPFIVKNGLYQRFLEKKYRSIEKLNKRYNEKNRSFSSVKPPEKESDEKKDHFKILDWVLFRETLPALYMRELIEVMYSLGCRGPFGVNDPLLGYTTSWYDVYRIVQDERWDIVIGYTHYQGDAQEESLIHHLLKIEYTYASHSTVVSNMEMQTGDAYFLRHWKQNSSDHKLTWKVGIGAGANMLNYYWFADGTNFSGYEHFLPESDFNSPVDKNGIPRPHFYLLKRVNSIIKKYPNICETTPVYDLTVGFYHPYSRMTKFKNPHGINDLEVIPSAVFVGSMIDLLGVCNINFQLFNLEDEIRKKSIKKRLIFHSECVLNKTIQQKLLDHALQGGHLILISHVPMQDEEFKECRILYNALGLEALHIQKNPVGVCETNTVHYYEHNYDLPVNSDIEIYKFKNRKGVSIDLQLKDAGEVCGFSKKTGKGIISVMGFTPRLFLDISRKFIRDYLGKKSRDQVLIFKRRKGDFTLITACNLKDVNEEIKIDGSAFLLPPRDALFIIKEKDKLICIK